LLNISLLTCLVFNDLKLILEAYTLSLTPRFKQGVSVCGWEL